MARWNPAAPSARSSWCPSHDLGQTSAVVQSDRLEVVPVDAARKGVMGRLTTHVLDTASGRPAAGITVELFRVGADARVAVGVTNADGRLDRPLAEGAALPGGTYELRFHAGDYLRRAGRTSDPPFLDVVPIRFGVVAGESYHVPLILSPFGYATYRGS